MADITHILQAIDRGDARAAEELLPLVYEELRNLASRKLAKEAPGQTLQATALVHEVWLKMAGPSSQEWKDRSHFFGAAAESMRRILIDKARRKAAQKRGASAGHEVLHESRIELVAPSEEVLAVNDALDELEREDPLAAQVVKLRYFVGLGIAEIAEALNMSERSVDRQWSFARAWLKRKLSKESLLK